MHVIPASELQSRAFDVFCAAGSPEPASRQVASSLVESNLVGHDSHGVRQIPGYVQSIQGGELRPAGQIQAVRERGASALLDCGWTFGQVAATYGMRMAIAKAQQYAVGVVVLRHCWHVGRLGEFAVEAAQQGLVGLVLCSGTDPGGLVAPFGGTAKALGANPMAWAVPAEKGRPIFLDFATSAVAQGKLMIAAEKGQQIPEGWLLDKDGRPSTDPADAVRGGAMLPFGGHKGYAMCALLELIGDGLSGSGHPLMPAYAYDQSTVLMAIQIEAFQPLEDFRQMALDFSARLKATPHAPGFDEILLPGEPEWRCKQSREREGIPVPVTTWERLGQTARSLGLAWTD